VYGPAWLVYTAGLDADGLINSVAPASNTKGAAVDYNKLAKPRVVQESTNRSTSRILTREKGASILIEKAV
jgi:hypothetical protein